MKKTIVSGLVITVIGAVMLAFGIGMHGQRAVIFDGLTPHVVSKAKTTRTQTYAKAERIKADVSDMNVVVKSGKTFSVKYAGEKINQPTIQKKNGTVIINSKSHKHGFSFNGFSFSSTGVYHGAANDKLTITVPENVNLKYLALRASDGKVIQEPVAKMKIEKYDLRVNDASQVSLSNLEIEQADFQLNDTDTVFNGVTINNGQLHLNDNDLAVNDSTLTKMLIQTADSDITMNKLTKSNDRIIAGVCGGIAEYFGFDATIVRLVTAALALFTAIVPSVILYLIAAMIIPDASPKKTVDDGPVFYESDKK